MPGISILLDGAPDHIPEARELGWRFIDSHPGSCWAPVPGMRFGMNWPATRATYIGAAGCGRDTAAGFDARGRW